MGTYDRSSKYLIERHGDAILRLAGFGQVRSWKALQPEVVQPGQLPDGLIEAFFDDDPEPRLFIIEIATYPERRLVVQLTRDALLVYLNRKVLPEVIAIVLHPKGRLEVPRGVDIVSPSRSTSLHLKWQVIEVWNVPAEDLLATGDPGLMPWTTLSRTQRPPETLMGEIRRIIDRTPDRVERESLLIAARVLASLRYNVPDVLRFFGGREQMIESPYLEELRKEFSADARADAIIKVLDRRLGRPSEETVQLIRSVRSEERFDDLLNAAIDAPSLAEFDAFLRQ